MRLPSAAMREHWERMTGATSSSRQPKANSAGRLTPHPREGVDRVASQQ